MVAIFCGPCYPIKHIYVILYQIQPIPSEESLQQKLQDQANWDAFKTMTVSNCVVLQKRQHEHDFDDLYI